jgi:hypothetical protein
VTLTAVSLKDTRQSDFALACVELTLAKRAQQAKDTPTARARVHQCGERVDAILDMSNGLTWDQT